MSFGLKGQFIIAQGTALGLKALISERSERAAYKGCPFNKKSQSHVSCPFRA